MDPVVQAVSKIIKEQQAIIGPIALDQAKKVNGLTLTSTDDVKITGNKKQTLDNLVRQFEKFLGQASIQVCKEAFKPFSEKISQTDIPDILRN